MRAVGQDHAALQLQSAFVDLVESLLSEFVEKLPGVRRPNNPLDTSGRAHSRVPSRRSRRQERPGHLGPGDRPQPISGLERVQAALRAASARLSTVRQDLARESAVAARCLSRRRGGGMRLRGSKPPHPAFPTHDRDHAAALCPRGRAAQNGWGSSRPSDRRFPQQRSIGESAGRVLPYPCLSLAREAGVLPDLPSAFTTDAQTLDSSGARLRRAGAQSPARGCPTGNPRRRGAGHSPRPRRAPGDRRPAARGTAPGDRPWRPTAWFSTWVAYAASRWMTAS